MLTEPLAYTHVYPDQIFPSSFRKKNIWKEGFSKKKKKKRIDADALQIHTLSTLKIKGATEIGFTIKDIHVFTETISLFKSACLKLF